MWVTIKRDAPNGKKYKQVWRHGMLVVVDTREPKDVDAYLTKFGCRVKRGTLTRGDYATQHVVIERKSLADFEQSLITKRIWKQMDKLSQDSRVKFLVLHDGLQPKYVDLNPFLGALVSISARYDVHIITTHNKASALYVISRIVEKGYRGKLCKPKILRTPARNKVQHTAQVLHVSENVARELLARFGSLKRILLAPDKEILKTPGVGPATLKRIRELVG